MRSRPALASFLALLFSASPAPTQAPDRPPPAGPALRGAPAPTVDLRWYRDVQERPAQDSGLALAVAISGGGHRAGNFGAGVLLALEKIPHGDAGNLLHEVDFFSTVSGGGLPVAAYLSERFAHRGTYAPGDAFFERVLAEFCPGGRSEESRGGAERCLLFNLRRSYYRGFWSAVHPVDRVRRRSFGDYVEAQFDRRLLGMRAHPEAFDPERPGLRLSHLFRAASDEERPLLPYWFANATVQANGAIFPFSPDILARYDLTQYRSGFRYDGVRGGWGDFPVSVAVKSSAAFPPVIHATVLGSPRERHERYVRLIDGGASDNLGVLTAAHLLCESPPARRKVLLVVDAFPGDGDPYEQSWRGSRMASLVRLPSLSLDSWHSRYRDYLSRMARGPECGFKVVYLSFDELVAHAFTREPAAPADLAACARLLGEDGFALPGRETLETLRDATAATGTNLRMSAEAQAMLMRAGRMVVCLNLPRIRQAIHPTRKPADGARMAVSGDVRTDAH